MGFSLSLRPHTCHFYKFCSLRVHGRNKSLSFVKSTARCCALQGINSVLGDRKSSISSNETPQPARALLERLFAQTQKLEEHMNGNTHLVQDVHLFDLENLESDLHAALEALRKKEEDLQEAERMVKWEHAELSQAREELEQREKEIAAACSKQEKLEDELRQANLKLVSQARHIEDLKLRLKERDQDIALERHALLSKEDEIDRMGLELMRKHTEAEKADAELKSKVQLLDEAYEVVKKQEIELRALENSLHEKQVELESLLARRQLEEEKVNAAETKLEKQTMEWLLAQEELKKLGMLASKHIGESKETMEDFQRVKRLLVDVRAELVSSQQSLSSSRQKMEERELLLEKQFLELEEQKETITSYMNGLRNAQIEVESERAKLRVTEARNKELESDLSLKRDLIQDLQEELDKEKTSLQQAIQELCLLREELNDKNIEFEETNNLLGFKEKELVEARVEIQHLKSEQHSLQLVLRERDLELVTARRKVEEVNAEVTELRMLLNGKEDQLILATDMLKEKEDYAQVMLHELNEAKVKASEAESVVGNFLNLTHELVIASKEDDPGISTLLGEMGQFPLQPLKKPSDDYRWQKKQLESELELTRENLRAKEIELLAAQRQLNIKYEELNMVLQRLEEKDAELKELRDMLRDAREVKKLSTPARDSACENDREDLAIEKLHLEAAQLEVEAATSALHKLAEMSRQLLNKANLSIDADLDVNVFPQNVYGSNSCVVENEIVVQKEPESNLNVIENDEFLAEVKSEVARLSALTERLVREAGAVASAT